MVTICVNGPNEAYMPKKFSDGARGFDCFVAASCVLMPGETQVMPLGFWMSGSVACEIRPRSSSSKRGLLIHLGTIDTDYRGEVKVCITNLRSEPVVIHPTDRLCQLVPEDPTAVLVWGHVDNDTARGDGGFGSTGQ